jgi:hypothetical protein
VESPAARPLALPNRLWRLVPRTVAGPLCVLVQGGNHRQASRYCSIEAPLTCHQLAGRGASRAPRQSWPSEEPARSNKVPTTPVEASSEKAVRTRVESTEEPLSGDQGRKCRTQNVAIRAKPVFWTLEAL